MKPAAQSEDLTWNLLHVSIVTSVPTTPCGQTYPATQKKNMTCLDAALRNTTSKDSWGHSCSTDGRPPLTQHQAIPSTPKNLQSWTGTGHSTNKTPFSKSSGLNKGPCTREILRLWDVRQACYGEQWWRNCYNRLSHLLNHLERRRSLLKACQRRHAPHKHSNLFPKNHGNKYSKLVLFVSNQCLGVVVNAIFVVVMKSSKTFGVNGHAPANQTYILHCRLLILVGCASDSCNEWPEEA